MSERVWLVLLLVALGAGWGATQPLTKVAVSTGHGPLGLIFWQLVIGAVLLRTVLAVQRRPLPRHQGAIAFYLLIAVIGTLLPNSASYLAARDLPAGVLSIVIALVPMFAFPIALTLRTDRFGTARLAGLCLGLVGVLLLALPEASLPEAGMLAALPLALVAPFLYAVEGNVVARWGTAGCDAVQTLCGASTVGALIALPMALASGQFIDPRAGFGPAEQALVATSLIHGPAYAAYIWLIGRAGAVFAAQASYLVTGFGVGWAMLFLGERYSGTVWLALLAMMAGLFLVQPRGREMLAAPVPAAKDTV